MDSDLMLDDVRQQRACAEAFKRDPARLSINTQGPAVAQNVTIPYSGAYLGVHPKFPKAALRSIDFFLARSLILAPHVATRRGLAEREEVDLAIALQRMEELNNGDSESRTLAEIVAVDFNRLMANLNLLDAAGIRALPQLGEIGISQRMRVAASHLIRYADESAVRALSHHRSDTVRGIAAFAVAELGRGAGVSNILSSIESFADDQHFGVREWAWMAVREDLAPLWARQSRRSSHGPRRHNRSFAVSQ